MNPARLFKHRNSGASIYLEDRRNTKLEHETEKLKIAPEPCFEHTQHAGSVIIVRPDDESPTVRRIREKRNFVMCERCRWLIAS